MTTIKIFAEHEAAIIYADMVNKLEPRWKSGRLCTRLEMVEWCIEQYGYVNSILFRLIEKLYADGFIKA